MINKSLWERQIIICITMDLEWASDDAIKYTINLINKYTNKFSIFISHSSKYIMEILKSNEIDIGIYPDFLKNSKHGRNPKEVMNYFIKFIPNAISFRCHKYYDSMDICEILFNNGFKYDSNVFTNLEYKEPFLHKSGLIRFPVYFDDNHYIYQGKSLNFTNIKDNIFNKPGLYVFNIHPMLMSLNPPDYSYIRKVKSAVPQKTWNNLTHKEIQHISYRGKGLRNFVLDVFKYIKSEGYYIYSLNDIYENAQRK